jgi:hypothetical protein
MYDFTPQFVEFFAQMFWGAIYFGMIFLTCRLIAFFFMPWKIFNS